MRARITVAVVGIGADAPFAVRDQTTFPRATLRINWGNSREVP